MNERSRRDHSSGYWGVTQASAPCAGRNEVWENGTVVSVGAVAAGVNVGAGVGDGGKRVGDSRTTGVDVPAAARSPPGAAHEARNNIRIERKILLIGRRLRITNYAH